MVRRGRPDDTLVWNRPRANEREMKRTTTSEAGMAKLREFIAADNGERVFEWGTYHPSQPTGFCPCDRSFFPRAWFYVKATRMIAVGNPARILPQAGQPVSEP